ncbi:hypothetical protein Tco_1363101 [Tanacetum coccineum]
MEDSQLWRRGLEELVLRWQVGYVDVRIECIQLSKKGILLENDRLDRESRREDLSVTTGRSNAPTNESFNHMHGGLKISKGEENTHKMIDFQRNGYKGVLTRTGLHRPNVSTARPVCTARPSVSTARPVCTARLSVSTARPVCTARPSVSTARPICTARPVSTARPVCTARPSVSTARPVCTARPSVSTARPVCTARPSVSTARPVYATRPIYPKLAFRPKDLKQDVKTFRVQNMTIVGTRAVVNTWANPEFMLQDHAVGG